MDEAENVPGQHAKKKMPNSQLYTDFLNRQIGTDRQRWFELYEPLLGLIALSQGEGLTRARLEKVLGRDLRSALSACAQYLTGQQPDGPFHVFHQSFADFLLREESNTHFRIQPDMQRRLHAQLLDSYEVTRWRDLPLDEPYLWDHLAYHLHAAGRDDELKALFEDQGWMHARVARDGYTFSGYLQDLNIAWEHVAHKTALAQIDAGSEPTALADCVRYALIHTSINSLAENHTPESAVRAVERQAPDPEQRGKLHVQFSDEWSRADTLTVIALQLDGEQRDQVLRQALNAALAIPSEWAQAAVLAGLAPLLDGERLQQALDAALAISNERRQIRALTRLARQLDSEQRSQVIQRALATTLAISDEEERAEALTLLAPHLDGEQRSQVVQQALDAALAISDEWEQAMALAVLAPQLDSGLLQQALSAALVISDEWSRAVALAVLAPQLDGELLQRALDAALALSSEWAQAEALTAIGPLLDGEQRSQIVQQALNAALATSDERSRVTALTALAPHLDGEQRSQAVQRALTSALTISDEPSRADALAALAPHLDGELLQQALAAALALSDEESQMQALTSLLSASSSDATLQTQLIRQTRLSIARALLSFRARPRKDVLRFLTIENLLAPPIFSQDTLGAIARHIIEICHEWSWL